VFNPKTAAVTVYDFERDAITIPVMCLQCDAASCAAVCPTHAINFDSDGRIQYDRERCIVCKLCVQACPLGNISYAPQTRKIVRCDLCDGEPQCAIWCHTGAITYSETGAHEDKKRAVAANLKAAMAEEVAA
jgi:Fe-S-cluster-containing hydrogenase component 2